MIHRLSPRQREIMARICAGLVQKEIAAELQITLPTVKGHIRQAKRRLAARTLAHAAILSASVEAQRQPPSATPTGV